MFYANSIVFSLFFSLFFFIECIAKSVAWRSLIYWINIDFSFDLQMSHPEKALIFFLIEIPVQQRLR